MTTAGPVTDGVGSDHRILLAGGQASSASVIEICAGLALEGVLMALLYSSSSRWMAWMYGVLNAAAIAWIWYTCRPDRKSTLTIGADDIEVALAQQIRFRFRHAAVVAVESATWRSTQDVVPEYLDAAYPLEPNVLVTLDRPVAVRLAIGVTKSIRRIAFRVENAENVLTALRAPIASVRTRS